MRTAHGQGEYNGEFEMSREKEAWEKLLELGVSHKRLSQAKEGRISQVAPVGS